MGNNGKITDMLKAANMSADELGYTLSDYYAEKENVFLRRLESCNLGSAQDIWQYTFFLTIVLVCEAERRSKQGLRGWEAFNEVFPKHECFHTFYKSYVGEFPVLSLNDTVNKIVATINACEINSEHKDFIDKLK
jgi:hypothetical protein